MEKEKEVCELHKSLECEVNKGKFFRKVFGGKIFLSISGTAFLFMISWGIWVTNFIYTGAAQQSSERTSSQKLSKDVDEVKKDMKEIKDEIKFQNDTINKNQQDMLKLLIDIQKGQRKGNEQKTETTDPR